VALTCAFIYFELQNGLGWPNVRAGIVVVLVLAPLLGLILDRFIFRRLTQASDASKIMATVGVLIQPILRTDPTRNRINSSSATDR
jgi:branched-subunit amino acid ABC-type transport system permease component